MSTLDSALAKTVTVLKKLSLKIENSLDQYKSNFQRRDAVKYRVSDSILGHLFHEILLTQPTYCSQCNNLLYGFHAQACKLCSLVSHRDCLLKLATRCALEIVDTRFSRQEEENTNEPRQRRRHGFQKRVFFKPTYCIHCGTMIFVNLPHFGLECDLKEGGCGITIHFECENKVHQHCRRVESRFAEEAGSIGCKNTLQSGSCQGSIGIEDFSPIKSLGRGSQAKVLLAELKGVPDQRFAIKVIKKTNIAIVSDPESVKTEVEVLKLGKQCPFVAKIHCSFQTVDRLFIVMEYVDGKDLCFHTLENGRKFTEHQARFYAAEIFLAIKYLHTNKIIHRDLKLENVILDKSGHCKLVDFGLSKELLQRDAKTRTFCGTPRYISPEVIKELPYSYSVDWWALGILLFEMLVGFSPFDCDNSCKEEELYENILKEQDPLKNIPDRFFSLEARDLLNRLLIKDPFKRIGCQQIEQHDFFRFKTDCKESILKHRWQQIANKELKVPYLPKFQDNTSDHESELDLTPITREQLLEVSQSAFRGFSCCSKSFEKLVETPLIEL